MPGARRVGLMDINDVGLTRRQSRVMIEGTQNSVDGEGRDGTDQATQLAIVADQPMNFIGADKSGIDADLRGQKRD